MEIGPLPNTTTHKVHMSDYVIFYIIFSYKFHAWIWVIDFVLKKACYVSHIPKRINGIYYDPSKFHKLVDKNED
jgi:hypothetical protein